MPYSRANISGGRLNKRSSNSSDSLRPLIIYGGRDGASEQRKLHTYHLRWVTDTAVVRKDFRFLLY